MIDANDHFRRLADLLAKESEAEAHQIVERIRSLPNAKAEASGYAYTDLAVRDSYVGMGGRFLYVFKKRVETDRLPWSRLGSGSPVLCTLQAHRVPEGQRGVIVDRERHSVVVAFDEALDEPDYSMNYRLDIAPDEAARIRQRKALDRAASAKRDRLAELRDVLLGVRPPDFRDIEESETLDLGLNESQRRAVDVAMAAKDISLLHGPPGTGKTTTVVEVIRRAVRRGQRVLVCAPSNIGVDNVLEKLTAFGENAVRLGHPARVLDAVRERSLDMLVEKHPEAKQARKLAKEAFALFRQAGKWTRAKPEPGAKGDMRREAKTLLADSRRLEEMAVQGIIAAAAVVCATLTGLDDGILGDRRFDLLVIDEACQSTEPACWIPLGRADRVLLAGDPCQLPPTVLSKEAEKRGFAVSLLERLMRTYPEATRRLDVQYRMHEAIMSFSSREFYGDTLVAADAVRGHLLRDLPGVSDTPLSATPVSFIDTAGAGYDEEVEPDGESKRNPQEAALAAKKVRELLGLGLSPAQVAVISPYAAQVRLLRRLLADVPDVEIDSVDGFQGREKEAVVITLVRSNAEGEIGFLGDTRRTNVALTRARRKLVVIGDSATLAREPFYARMWEYAEEVGGYSTVWEE